MNIRRKMRLFDQNYGYDVPFLSDLRAYVEVVRITTNSRPKHTHFCKLHFSNGDAWELKTFTQRSKRCRAFEGICEFIKQYSSEPSIIFVTDCPLDVFHAGEIKSDYLGWREIIGVLRDAFGSRRHRFGLQYLPTKDLRQTIDAIEIRRKWDRKAALAAKGEASASKQSQSNSAFAFLKKGGSEDV